MIVTLSADVDTVERVALVCSPTVAVMENKLALEVPMFT